MAKDTVLVVDDDAGVRDFAREALEGDDYYAVAVPDAAAAARVLDALALDLILFDHGPEPRLAAARAKAGGVIPKPTETDGLLARVRAELGGRWRRAR